MENMKRIPGAGTLHLYQVSADGGNSWTDQWLTENEVTEHRERLGCLVRKSPPLDTEQEITRAAIRIGIDQGTIRFEVDPVMKSGTVAYCGEYWFYFGGETAEQESPETYLQNASMDEIVDNIYAVLSDFRSESPDEYQYYEAVLSETVSAWWSRQMGQVTTAMEQVYRILDDMSTVISGENPEHSGIHLEPDEHRLTENLKELKSVTLHLPNRAVPVTTWRQAVKELLLDCNSDPQRHLRMMELRDRVHGRSRVILASNPAGMNVPLQIDHGLYMEGYFDTEQLFRILTTEIFDRVGYDYSKIRVQCRPGRGMEERRPAHRRSRDAR